MPMEDEVPMIVEEGVKIVEEIVVACRLPMIDKLMISIVVRVCFVYGFRLV
jgi:mannose/fructose/N-acetylgalactosamine-specific phosphotransferase system component IIC